MKRPRLPEPPTDVRLVYVDGTVQPVEVRYTGRRADGIAHWAVTATPDLGEVAAVAIGVLPPKTAVDVVVLGRMP